MASNDTNNWYEKCLAQLSKSLNKAELLEILLRRISDELESEYFLIDLIMKELWEEPPE